MVRLDVDALTELGLFRFAPDRKRAIELAHEQGYAFAGETRRLYHADAEALAERVPAKNGKPAGFDVASLDADGWLSPGGPNNDLHVALVTPAMADVVNRAAAPRARLVPADRG